MNMESNREESNDVKPYISPLQTIKEFTIAPLIIGTLLGIVFGASSLYLVLKVGMTISASIPIAVISITLFKFFSKLFKIRTSTILENNIVQTAGSAGESIAFGVGVTMPTLMILGYDMDVSRVMIVATLGGILGILMMIPLRRGLIVKQHKTLTYPEGTACAKVLIVGEEGGTNAKTVFTGFGIGLLYKFCVEGLRLWSAAPSKVLTWYQGVKISSENAPELLGVGYIIGPRTSAIMMGGGVLSTLVLIPLIKLVGTNLTTPLYPASTLISSMETHDIWKSYILYIGAGAVAMGGIVSLFRSLPLIVSSFKAGLGDFSFKQKQTTLRTDRDLPLIFVLLGTVLLVLAIWLTPILNFNLIGAVLVVLFGFLFVTVSSRITGEIGSSSNPISGMTVSTLLLTCLIFLALGWTGTDYKISALSIAAVVCIAASNAGTTSQDLKTGYLVGATPYYQQLAILIGAVVSALVIGKTLVILNDASTVYSKLVTPSNERFDPSLLPEKTTLKGEDFKYDQREFHVLHLDTPKGDLLPGRYLINDQGEVSYLIDPGINGVVKYRDYNFHYEAPPANNNYKVPDSLLNSSSKETLRGEMGLRDTNSYVHILLEKEEQGLPAGNYLADSSGVIKYKIDQGKEVVKYDSPKAKLMSLIIDGILTQKLPWDLVLIGALIAILLELCGVSSLPFAVGVYLPFSASFPIFLGGMVRYLVDFKRDKKSAQTKDVGEDENSSSGILLSSGLIAGGSIAGILLALVAASGLDSSFDIGRRFLGSFSEGSMPSMIIFLLLALYLFGVGKKKFLK